LLAASLRTGSSTFSRGYAEYHLFMSAMPDFIIIGAQKAGTTAAARNLALHPQIRVFSGTTEYGQKEIEFFNQHWERGTSWYASHFQPGQFLNGEKTAELLHRLICHKRMHETNPRLKLVVLLRSPVERAYSQWKMAAYIKRDETRTFERTIYDELPVLECADAKEHFYTCSTSSGLSCWREGYLWKGLYAEQLEALYKWFPRSQVFIGISEQIRKDLKAGYCRICEFLDLPPTGGPFVDHFISPPAPPMRAAVRDLLSEVYRESNNRLFALIGTGIPEWK